MNGAGRGGQRDKTTSSVLSESEGMLFFLGNLFNFLHFETVVIIHLSMPSKQ